MLVGYSVGQSLLAGSYNLVAVLVDWLHCVGCVGRYGSAPGSVNHYGSGRLLWDRRYESVGLGRFGSVWNGHYISRSLWVGRCGLVAVGLVAVGWSLWVGRCGLVAVGCCGCLLVELLLVYVPYSYNREGVLLVRYVRVKIKEQDIATLAYLVDFAYIEQSTNALVYRGLRSGKYVVVVGGIGKKWW